MHPQKARSFIYNSPIPPVTTFNLEQFKNASFSIVVKDFGKLIFNIITLTKCTFFYCFPICRNHNIMQPTTSFKNKLVKFAFGLIEIQFLYPAVFESVFTYILQIRL